MSKELKLELFNIYDVVVFEDETGITQDCVCDMLKDKDEEAEVVGVVGCNNHHISIYENGSYKVWEKDGKDLPYYSTNKKIIHLYTLKNDNRFYEVYPTDDYKLIYNTEPSEALDIVDSHLETLKKEKYNVTWLKQDFTTIKQVLIKAQEKEELFDYLIKFIKNVEINDNGIYYVSFRNNTPYLNCIEINKEHYNKFKKIKETQGE